MKRAVVVLLSLIVFASCGEENKTKVASQGGAYEVIVVADHAKWEGKVGDTIRSIMLENVPMLSRREPLFNVLRVQPSGYAKMILQHRNHLVLKTGKHFASPSLSVQYDVHALSQVVVTVLAPDDAALADYLGAQAGEIKNTFTTAERDRRVKYITSYPATAVNDAVRDTFGFDISIPQGYRIRNQKSDFMWISNETHVSEGIVIYSYPISSTADLDFMNLLKKRDEFVRHIPGPSDGSFMITANVMPQVRSVRLGGRTWVRMAGYWDVAKDFMGGPMRNYTTVDWSIGKVVSIDFYVYSPNIPQRNLMYETEDIIHTVKFPGEVGDAPVRPAPATE